MITEGDCVIFIGCTDEQVNWGSSNDDPRGVLTQGQSYCVKKVEVHSYHTKLTLKGIDGKFNSVSFSKLNGDLD